MMQKLYIQTNGCQMNEYDSDKMRDVLNASHGFELIDDPKQADVLLLNTCSIRESDRVHAHLLHDLELALDAAVERGGAERAEIVVQAHALQRDVRAVEQKAAVGGERDGANAERGARRRIVTGRRRARASRRCRDRDRRSTSGGARDREIQVEPEVPSGADASSPCAGARGRLASRIVATTSTGAGRPTRC